MSNKITKLVFIGLIILTFFFLFRPSVSNGNTKQTKTILSVVPVVPTIQPTSFPTNSVNDKLPEKQIIKATYSFGKGLWPTEFTVNAGIPVRLEVYAEIDGVGCMGSIMIPYLSDSIQDFVKLKTNIFEFTPEAPGKYEITCAMGIPHGLIIVE